MPFTYLSDYAPLIRRVGLETEIDLPTSVDVGFDLFLQGEGWSAPEVHAAGWFRWLGDTGVGRVRILVDRSKAAYLGLEIFASVSERVLLSVKVFCDGVLVETRVNPGATLPVIEGVLPRKNDQFIGLTTIEIAAAETVRGQGEDTRQLSIALQRLIVTPLDDDHPSTDRKVTLLGDLLGQFDDLEKLLAVKPRQNLWRENFTYSEPILVSLYDEPGYAHLKIRLEKARLGALSGLFTFNLRRGGSPDLGVEFRINELSPDFRKLFTFPLEDEYGPRTEFQFTPDQTRTRWALGPIDSGGERVRGLLTSLAIELEQIVAGLASEIDESPVDWLALAAEVSGYARGTSKESAVGSSA